MSARAPRVLLVVDVFNHFRFVDGEALADALLSVCSDMASAMAACRERDIPVVFCNDNFGRWNEPWDTILEFTAREGLEASRVLLPRLRPQSRDVVLLKSRHSAFFQTQLPAFLTDQQVKEVAIAGAATDACVLCTANDAHVRGFDTYVLSDITAAASRDRHDRALHHLRESTGIHITSHMSWVSRAATRDGSKSS